MFVKPSRAFVGWPSEVASSSGSAKNARYARLLPSTRKSSDSRAGPLSSCSSWPVRVFGDIAARLPRVPRVPMLAGSRVAVVSTSDDDVVLQPPPPGQAIADVGAAVAEALRF